MHLFVNPIDDNAPTESTDDIIYFGPGYHRARNDITPDSGQTVYLANGAVVSGHIEIAYVENVTVKGSGIIMKDDKSIGSGRAINVTQSKNIKISGIISNIHRNNDWTTRIHRSSEVTLDNYKVVSPQWASTDGVDIVNCNNININDCFLRATDDTITIKGIADDAVIGEALDSPPANEKINVTNTILWNECNSAMVVGEETQAKYYKDIHFKNIDVIFSYDDIEYHNSLYERSVMSIINGLGNPMEDISWEDIRVNECERLICFAFIDEFYTIPVNPETCQILPGYMKNITVKNVVSNSTSNGAYANQIYLKGWDANKNISNVTFDNIVIKGEKLTESSPLIVKNEFVNNLEVK